jgi:hypothetical protein
VSLFGFDRVRFHYIISSSPADIAFVLVFRLSPVRSEDIVHYEITEDDKTER